MDDSGKVVAIILAAGKGTRLELDVPKVLAPLHHKPMIFWIIEAIQQSGINQIIVVIGHRADEVKKSILDAGYPVKFAYQEHQIGTGNAVQIAMDERSSSDHLRSPSATMDNISDDTKTVLITYGDKPLISPGTFSELVRKQQSTGAVAVISTVDCPNPSEMGFGRIKRDNSGNISHMVEQKECSAKDLLITECNGGPVAHDAKWLKSALVKSKKGSSGEIYLTDLVRLAYEEGQKVETVPMSGIDEAHGVNTLEHLQEAEKIIAKTRN